MCHGPNDQLAADFPRGNNDPAQSVGLGAASAAAGSAAMAVVMSRSHGSPPAHRAQGTAAAPAALALAAVATQGATACRAFASPAPDFAFTRPVRPARPSVPVIASTAGLGAGAASALNALLVAEANAWVLVQAGARARARALGAVEKHNLPAGRRQTLAAAGFAAQAARALRRLPVLRTAAATALRAGNVAEITLTIGDIARYQASVRRSGIPSAMRALLVSLGLNASEIRHAQELLLATPQGSAAGDVLIAPLASATQATAVKRSGSALDSYAKAARKRPIVSSRPGPLTIPATRGRPRR